MLKQKILLIWAILLIFFAHLGAGKAMAFSDYCEDPSVAITDPSGWRVELVSVLPAGTDLWEWTYSIQNSPGSGSATGLNFAAMLVPDCCAEPKIVVETVAGFTEYFNVGEGEPTLSFGKYNLQARVAKGTPDNSYIWSFVANTDRMTSSTILLKVKKIGTVTFEMAVPGCASEESPAAATASITLSAEEFTYINNGGQTYKVTVYKNQWGNITKIERTDPDGKVTDITDEGVSVTQILASFTGGDGTVQEEFFNYVPNDTVTKSGDDSTCGYWYAGKFWNFCY
jgi:hypothetical protein